MTVMPSLRDPVDAQTPRSRAALVERYREVRRFTETLCAPLETEDYVVQPMPDASPAKWHLAHSSWFFETFVLKPHAPRYHEIDPAYAYLFNSYYVQAGARHCRDQRGMVTRPTVSQTYAYRAHVDQQVEDLLVGADEPLLEALAPLVTLGTHHEQQHQELLITDVKYLFSRNPLRPAYDARAAPEPPSKAPSLKWASFPGGLREVGHSGSGFCFDNETPRHPEYVEPFRLASRPVTNGEYLEFIGDGGYDRADLWVSDGWAEASRQEWRAPLYWEREGRTWQLFTTDGMQRLDPEEPVCHVSYYEADAYARWRGARLASETEWEVAAEKCALEGHFVESHRCHPRPAGGRGALLQLYGDIWEWTRSPYAPYPGFQPLPGALGEYNGKFMCNQFVLRGGSCATSITHIRPTYRNFFHPHCRWQFSGMRLAADGG